MGAFPGRCTESSTYTHRNGVRAGDGESGSHETALLLHTFAALAPLLPRPLFIPRPSICLCLSFSVLCCEQATFFSASQGEGRIADGYKKVGPSSLPHKRAHVT